VSKATLPTLIVTLLGLTAWASVAAAQTDDSSNPPASPSPASPSAGEGSPEASQGAAPDAPTTAEPPADSTEALPSPTVPAAADGESSDGSQVPAAPAAEEAPPPSPPELPWRNTFFSWTHQATFNSFLRNAQLTYNPVYQQQFNIAPRWYLAPRSYFLFSQSLSLELTDSDFDARNRDPQLSDTVVEFRQMIPWEGFMFMGQARIGLPLSKASQAAQRYLQWGLGLTVVRTIPEINLTLAGIFAYRQWLAGSNVVQLGTPQPDRCAPLPPVNGGTGTPEIDTATCDQVVGPSAARDTILAGLSANFSFGELNINLQGFMFILQGYELAPAYINVATSPEPVMIADGSPTHWRNFTFFALSVGYQFTPWLNLAVGIQNSGFAAGLYNPDGSVRSPFNPDTQAFLSASVQLDSIYTELQGSEDDGLTPEERQRRRQGLASGPSTGGAF
jgi:hypothetical protein